jgi:MFS family permease
LKADPGQARLDSLPWSRFHWLLVIGLGITCVLDGLAITLTRAISAVLQRPDVPHFTAAEIGSISSAYLAGAVIGSLAFGHLTDRFGRRTFFFVTLAIYMLGGNPARGTASRASAEDSRAARFRPRCDPDAAGHEIQTD